MIYTQKVVGSIPTSPIIQRNVVKNKSLTCDKCKVVYAISSDVIPDHGRLEFCCAFCDLMGVYLLMKNRFVFQKEVKVDMKGIGQA